MLIAVLFLIVFYGLHLISLLRRSENMGGDSNLPTLISTKSESPAGEAAININEKSATVPFERVNINKVWVKNSKVYYKADGGIPFVDLEVGFINSGVQKTMTVTLVDKVLHYLFFQEGGVYKTDDKGMVSVDTIDYVKGEQLGLVLAYFPPEISQGVSKLSGYCSLEKDPVCSYISSGFGGSSISVNDLSPDFVTSDKVFLPSQVAVWGLSRNLVLPKIE